MKLTVEASCLHTGVSAPTVVECNHRIRRCLGRLYENLREIQIGGPNMTVEIDEAHLYTNRRRIGRRLVGERYWIVAEICRETKEVFYAVTLVRSAEF
jgi:hypothetical protein